MSKFTEIAKKVSGNCDIIEGRKKLGTTELIEKYGDCVTITDFSVLTGKKGVTYVVATIAEDTSVFVFGGKMLTDIAFEWLKAFDGNAEVCREELKKTRGVRFKVTRKRTQSGNNIIVYTPIE